MSVLYKSGKMPQPIKRTRGFLLLSALLQIAAVNAMQPAQAAESKQSQAAVSDNTSDTEPHPAKAESESTGQSLNSDNINKLLESEDVYGEQFRVSSYVQGNEVTIQTWTNPKSKDPDRDYKINSVLIAKTLQEAFPGQIKICKVRYFERTDPKKYSEFTVVPGVVKSFAAGIMSESDLLTTIPQSHGSLESPLQASKTGSGAGDTTSSKTQSSTNQGTKGPDDKIASASVAKPAIPLDPNSIVTVLPGFEMTQRANLLDRIKDLESKGVKSPLARQMFATLEEAVRDGRETEARTAIARLDSSIADMEKNYRKAKAAKAVSGGPVTVRSVSPSHASAQGSSSAAQGSGSGGADFDSGIAIYKKKLGDLYPHYGPNYVDRVNIANALYQMQQNGQKIDQLKQSFLQMETLVVNGGGGIEQSIFALNGQLKLKTAEKDDEYKFQQRFADEHKGLDLK